jgi:hypothetical protein
MNATTLTLEVLNAALDEAVFAEPRDEQFIQDLMCLIGGDCNPSNTLERTKQAAYRVTLRLAAR